MSTFTVAVPAAIAPQFRAALVQANVNSSEDALDPIRNESRFHGFSDDAAARGICARLGI